MSTEQAYKEKKICCLAVETVKIKLLGGIGFSGCPYDETDLLQKQECLSK